MTRTLNRRAGLLTALAVAGGLAAAPVALGQGDANTVAVDAGETRLHLNAGTAKVLADNGIGVAPLGRATAQGARVNFPITGGEIVPNTGVGIYNHDGSGLRFTANGSRADLTSFNVNTRTGDLTALVANRRITVGNLLTGDAKVIRRGPGRLGTWTVRVQLNLSRPGAVALNNALNTRLFQAGLRLGRVDVRSEPAEIILDGGSTRVTLSQTAAAALQSLGISLSTVPPGAADTLGRLNFPIDGRKIDLNETSGIVAHEGGIALTRGATTVQLTEFNLQLGADVFPQVALTALINGANRTPIFLLDQTSSRTGVSRGQFVVTNVGLPLTAEGATALNAAFGVTGFTTGLDFGTARVQGRAR